MTERTENNVQWTNCLGDIDIEDDLISIDKSSLDLVIVELKEIIEEHNEYYKLCVSDY